MERSRRGRRSLSVQGLDVYSLEPSTTLSYLGIGYTGRVQGSGFAFSAPGQRIWPGAKHQRRRTHGRIARNSFKAFQRQRLQRNQ